MSMRRGFFRFWIVASVVWVRLVCTVAWLAEPPDGDYRVVVHLSALPPAFVLALGAALLWAAKGFGK